MPNVDQLLATKLYIPPIRPELVSRNRLIEQLNNGLHHKLTLISAPAGFGKTTLIGEWLASTQNNNKKTNQTENEIAWLSLDSGDNDLARFLTYFVTALSRVDGGVTTIGRGALAMVQSTQSPPVESVLTMLINDLAGINGRVIFVLDDYHVIDSQGIHDALNFFIENMPSQIHLVMATREDPLLPIPRLRVRNLLTELRAVDLRFTSSEVVDFLNRVMGLNLTTEDIAALETRTEGWIAGLQLAAISMRGRTDINTFVKSFTGSHRLVLDYLIEEVLDQQSEDVQGFLLQTSILDRLTGPLCDALTGKDNGQQVLEMFDHSNLFIVSLDEERRWYRYHHLFADLLRQRLSQNQPDVVQSLHLCASRWYEQNKFMDDAIEHSLVIREFDRTTHLIADHADALWRRGEHQRLTYLLKSVPIELIFSKPRLCVFLAWYSFLNGQQEITKQCIQAAEEALDDKSDHHAEPISPAQVRIIDPEKALLLGRIAAIRAFMDSFQGELSSMIQNAHRALDYLPDDERNWRRLSAMTLGDVYGYKGDIPASYDARYEAYRVCKTAGDIYNTMVASSKLAITLRAQGRLQETIDLCEEQIQTATEIRQAQPPLIGFIMVVLGEVLAELNNLDKALDLALEGINITENSDNLLFVGWGYFNLIRIHFSQGNLAAVEEIIEKLEGLSQESNVPAWVMGLMATWQVRTWLAQGNLDGPSQWAEGRDLNINFESPQFVEIDFFSMFDYIVLARIWMAQGQLEKTIKLLRHLFVIADNGGRRANMIEIMMLQALVFHKQGDANQALDALKRSFALAEPKGFIRTFVDEGPPMARLLYEALSHEISPDYVQRLLLAFPVQESEKAGSTQLHGPASELIEPLSERELEILQLIAGGLSNQEIGSQLYLSLNTVKAHTRNIYGKLGVNSRTQATARARAMGILLTA